MSARHVVVFLFVISLGVAILAALRVWIWAPTNQYEPWVGKKIEWLGHIESEPSVSAGGNQILVVRPQGFTQSVRVSLFQHGYYQRGDLVLARGKVKLPENFSQFNYVSYLKMNGIYAELGSAQVIVLDGAQGSTVEFLREIKSWIIRTIQFQLDIEPSALVLGMLIGHTEQLPKPTTEAYRRAGLSHILVVSGFNLTVLASSCGVLAWLIGRRRGDILGLGVIWCFVVVAGASGGVVRAGLMASLMLAGRMLGRLHASKIALLLAVIILVFLNPWRMFFDIGFQLSITATYGVLSALQLRTRFGKESKLSELLWPTTGAIIFTASLVAYYFGTFSIIAPLANILVLPLVPILMLVGALVLLPGISEIAGLLVTLLLDFQVSLVTKLANLPWAQISWRLDFPWVLGLYLCIIIVEQTIFSAFQHDLKKAEAPGKITKVII